MTWIRAKAVSALWEESRLLSGLWAPCLLWCFGRKKAGAEKKPLL